MYDNEGYVPTFLKKKFVKERNETTNYNQPTKYTKHFMSLYQTEALKKKQ